MSLRLQKKHAHRTRLTVRLLVACGVLALLGGAGIGLYQYATNRVNIVQITQEIDKANRGLPSSVPSTTSPSDDAFKNYHVAPDAPRYIYIDTISVKAMVKPMSLTSNNAIQAPQNVHDAGWFTGSAKPGQPGASVIDGHVANWATKSVFHDLKNVRSGDTITIERGDGTRLQYKVVELKSYPANDVDMQAVMTPITPTKPGLNLITCDGKVVRGNEFDRRLVVFTEQQAQ